ncbi:MlaC/ttg2D family ABC transporter substrate-binding protein [Antarcticimicrobium sediminis]|uniref:ABC transporter substrate-binding protein n=1 Tax=Antarcticimicrobium sediminis TaxID=2546227 RepID=A0A4R5EVV7_9RHOB|nr:ABC transporter substrate-binding protein [Antarcticimicrobium sediminis]TDE38972.1 ABC transporter substrate-binding protein [Antarcticimicrobium sediminis]
MTVNISRRHLIGTASAAAGLAMLPITASALNPTTARTMVDKLVAEINRVIDSGKSESAMYRDFERIFETYSDTSYIAAYALGVDGRRASSTQKRAFTDAFTGYISRKYGKRFREFIGGKLEVEDVRKVKNFLEVRTTAYLRGESPFEVAFHVSDRTGRELFFNIYIEGVNMLLTERTEIGSMLDARRGDIDAVIADLKRAG